MLSTVKSISVVPVLQLWWSFYGNLVLVCLCCGKNFMFSECLFPTLLIYLAVGLFNGFKIVKVYKNGNIKMENMCHLGFITVFFSIPWTFNMSQEQAWSWQRRAPWRRKQLCLSGNSRAWWDGGGGGLHARLHISGNYSLVWLRCATAAHSCVCAAAAAARLCAYMAAVMAHPR